MTLLNTFYEFEIFVNRTTHLVGNIKNGRVSPVAQLITNLPANAHTCGKWKVPKIVLHWGYHSVFLVAFSIHIDCFLGCF